MDVRPFRLLQGEPAAIGLKPPFGQPFGLALLGRDEPDDVLVEALGGLDRFNVGKEAVFVLVDVNLFDAGDGFLRCRHWPTPNSLFWQQVKLPPSGSAEPIDQLTEGPEESLYIGIRGRKTK